jgi:hypothetical protein
MRKQEASRPPVSFAGLYSAAMNRDTRERLVTFLKPFYQDLDGATRLDEVERIAAIAHRLYSPPAGEARAFELLLLFHRLRHWLEKVGNLSRTLLAVNDVTEQELRHAAASIRRLESPVTGPERATAAALLIDSAGVRGLMELVARARREGNSLMDVLRAALADVSTPEWLPENARAWLHQRREARREVCRQLLEELSLDDLAEGREHARRESRPSP